MTGEQKAEPVVVRIQRSGAAAAENASKLVGWIVRLTLNQRVWHEPKVGDTVVEVTHLIGMGRSGLGLHSAIGELLSAVDVPGEGIVHMIRTIEGVEQRWLNAKFAVVERKGG